MSDGGEAMDGTRKHLFRLKADVMKAAAHPIRLAIIDSLRSGERCVCDITRAVGAGRSNVSRHLAVMTRAGLLSSRKDGLMVYYSLRAPCILRFLSCVEDCLKAQLRENAAILRRL